MKAEIKIKLTKKHKHKHKTNTTNIIIFLEKYDFFLIFYSNCVIILSSPLELK